MSEEFRADEPTTRVDSDLIISEKSKPEEKIIPTSLKPKPEFRPDE